jgi:hypothetical protein
MNSSNDFKYWREPFPSEEIPFILAATLRCMDGEKKRHGLEKENDISFRLWKKLRLDSELLKRPVKTDTETWEINENLPSGTPGRLDIRFIYSTGINHPWPEFAIEAKRLHVEFPSGWKSLVSEYVTSDTAKPVEEEQGMMCFVSGRYSKGLRAGAMLGYVFDGNINGARESIADAIKCHARKLCLKQGTGFQFSAILPNGSGISETLHESNLPRQDNISTIYHLLVPV